MEKEGSAGPEWRINLPEATSKSSVSETGLVRRFLGSLKGIAIRFVLRIWSFLEKAWILGADEPRKVMHCLKVGLALSVVSLFYYMRPLYEGVGGNAMWAVMTVVVVFEYTVGATLSKSINRATATFLAGSLCLGVHWIASQSGENFEPVILGISVFILASATTFSRFIPSVKARFDYGCVIFILTFSLVSVSGFRVEKLTVMARQRLSTIAIGTSLCIIISMLLSPVWAGEELHTLINRNLEKLSDSLEGCITEYFKESETEKKSADDHKKKLEAYKFVLNSKAMEQSMADFARWEPAHGRFSFRHPWTQYLKVGDSIRNCAYCIETLNGCINSETTQASKSVDDHLRNVCMKLSTDFTNVLKELVFTVRTMTKSTKMDFLVGEMNFGVQEVQNALRSLPRHLTNLQPVAANGTCNDLQGAPITKTSIPLLTEVLPVATMVALLIEIAGRIEEVADTVEDLATMADFKLTGDEKPKQTMDKINIEEPNQDHETKKDLPQKP